MSVKYLNLFFPFVWRMLIIIAVLLQSGLIPLDFLFELRNLKWYIQLDGIISVLFFIDLCINFIGYKASSQVFFKDIYWDKQYSGNFLIVDILSMLPYTLLFSNPVFQLLRLLKWIRVFKIARFFQIQNIRFSARFSFGFLLLGFFLFTHWFSCIWIWIHGIEPGLSNTDNYIQSLYWVVTTLTSVGYGDIVPHGNPEMLFTILLQIMGVGVLAIFVGSVVGIFTKKNPAEKRFVDNIEKLRALIHYHEIPKDLEKRIRDYFTYEWKQKLGYDESELFSALPFGLRNELQFEFKKKVIKDIPLFDCVDDYFIRDIAQYLTPTILTPGDYLFRKGDVANSMFFVQKGRLQVLSSDELKQITLLKKGDFMGEIALFKDTTRTATVKSVGYSDLYELQKKEFDKVLNKYPEIAKTILLKSQSREQIYI